MRERFFLIVLFAFALPGCKPDSQRYRQVAQPVVDALTKVSTDVKHGTNVAHFVADRTAAGNALEKAKTLLSSWDQKRVSFGALIMSLEGYKQVTIVGTRPDRASADFVKLGDNELNDARQLLRQGK